MQNTSVNIKNWIIPLILTKLVLNCRTDCCFISCMPLIFHLHLYNIHVYISAPDSALYSVVRKSYPKNDVDLKCQAADPVVTINAETQLNMATKSEEVINV